MVTVPLKEIFEKKALDLIEIQVNEQSPKLQNYDRIVMFYRFQNLIPAVLNIYL